MTHFEAAAAAPVLLIVTLGKISLCECEKFQSTLTTSEKATDRELKRIVAMAAYLLSTKVASAAQEAVPSKPQRTKYDRLRYPNKGIPSLHSKIPKPLHHQLLGYMLCWVPLFKAQDLTKELIKQSMLGLMVP
jgi:hypothetical protein